MSMLEQKEQDKMVRLKAAQEASKKALEASKSGGVSGIAKAQKNYSSANNALSSSVAKEARLANASGAMKTASSLKGLSSSKKALDAAKLTGGVSKGAAAVDLASKAGLVDGDSEAGGGLQGAAAGASAGAAFGPWGAAVGGVLGGVTGAIGAGEKRKQKLAQIEAKKQQRLGEIAQNKADRLQQGFQSLGASLSGLFTPGRR